MPQANRNRNTRGRGNARRRTPQPVMQYLKLMVYYFVVVVLNLATSFRWEYIWPMFLLVQGVHDSYKFTGLGFAVMYVSVAVGVDCMLYLWIPVPFLFILASCGVFLIKFYDEQTRINAMMLESRNPKSLSASVFSQEASGYTPGISGQNHDVHDDLAINDLSTLSKNFNEADGHVQMLSPDYVSNPHANALPASHIAVTRLITIVGTLSVVLEIVWNTRSEDVFGKNILGNSSESGVDPPTQFNTVICRPLAAHCLGYPILQLGTQFYRMFILGVRLRNRHAIRQQNDVLYKNILFSAVGSTPSQSPQAPHRRTHQTDIPKRGRPLSSSASPHPAMGAGSNYTHQNHHNHQNSSASTLESLWRLLKQVISNPYSPYIDCAQQHINQFYEDDLIYRLEDNSTGLLQDSVVNVPPPDEPPESGPSSNRKSAQKQKPSTKKPGKKKTPRFHSNDNVSQDEKETSKFCDVDPITAKVLKTLQSVELGEHEKAIILAAVESSVRITQVRIDPHLISSGLIDMGVETLKLSAPLESALKGTDSTKSADADLSDNDSEHAAPTNKKSKKKPKKSKTGATATTPTEPPKDGDPAAMLLDAYSNSIYLRIDGLQFVEDPQTGKRVLNGSFVNSSSNNKPGLSQLLGTNALSSSTTVSKTHQHSNSSNLNQSSLPSSGVNLDSLTATGASELEKINPALILFHKLYIERCEASEHQARLVKEVARWKKLVSERDKRINTLKRDLDKVNSLLTASKAKERQQQYKLIELDNEKHELIKQLDDEISQRKKVTDEKTEEKLALRQQIKSEQEKSKEAAGEMQKLQEELLTKEQLMREAKTWEKKAEDLAVEKDELEKEREGLRRKICDRNKEIKTLEKRRDHLKNDANLIKGERQDAKRKLEDAERTISDLHARLERNQQMRPNQPRHYDPHSTPPNGPMPPSHSQSRHSPPNQGPVRRPPGPRPPMGHPDRFPHRPPDGRFPPRKQVSPPGVYDGPPFDDRDQRYPPRDIPSSGWGDPSPKRPQHPERTGTGTWEARSHLGGSMRVAPPHGGPPGGTGPGMPYHNGFPIGGPPENDGRPGGWPDGNGRPPPPRGVYPDDGPRGGYADWPGSHSRSGRPVSPFDSCPPPPQGPHVGHGGPSHGPPHSGGGGGHNQAGPPYECPPRQNENYSIFDAFDTPHGMPFQTNGGSGPVGPVNTGGSPTGTPTGPLVGHRRSPDARMVGSQSGPHQRHNSGNNNGQQVIDNIMSSMFSGSDSPHEPAVVTSASVEQTTTVPKSHITLLGSNNSSSAPNGESGTVIIGGGRTPSASSVHMNNPSQNIFSLVSDSN